MENFLTIKRFRLEKLNFEEYANFLKKTQMLIEERTTEALGIEEVLYNRFKAEILELSGSFKETRASAQTKEMTTADTSRGELVVYLLTNFRNERKSPVESKKKAAEALYNVTKSFIGIQSKPNSQASEYIERLIQILNKEENSSHVRTLGLNEAVRKLQEVNKAYQSLSVERSESLLSNKTRSTRQIRQQLDKTYFEITERIYARNIVIPSEETALLLSMLNRLIDEVLISLKLRLSKGKKEKK